MYFTLILKILEKHGYSSQIAGILMFIYLHVHEFSSTCIMYVLCLGLPEIKYLTT